MYKTKLPTQDRLNELFTYDAHQGLLRWRVRKTMRKPIGSLAGGLNGSGYITVRIDNKAYLAHRLIWKMVTGEEPDVIDHISRERNDNRMSNLRNCTAADNAANRSMHSNNTSGFTGVSWDKEKKKWFAQVTMHKRAIPLGYFDCAREASAAFERAAEYRKHLHGQSRMFKRLAREEGIYMVPVSCLQKDENNTIKYLSFKEEGLVDAIDSVFGGE